METKLALGTLKLEGSDLAVTQTQASQLLTLWEAYRSISNSDTSSQVELNALEKQIQGIMTADQLKAIEAIGLTELTVSETLQSMANNPIVSTSASITGASTNSQGGASGGPGGMPPDGGGMAMSDITSSVMAQTTPVATQPAASTQPTQVDVRLLDALIQLLVSRSQATG